MLIDINCDVGFPCLLIDHLIFMLLRGALQFVLGIMPVVGCFDLTPSADIKPNECTLQLCPILDLRNAEYDFIRFEYWILDSEFSDRCLSTMQYSTVS